MEGRHTSRKRDRFKSLFKRNEQSQNASLQLTSYRGLTLQHPSHSDVNDGDRQRSRSKYLDAVKLLEETVKSHEGQWGPFSFPELKGEPEDFNDLLFREKINVVLDNRKNKVQDQTAWQKCSHIIQCAFTAFSPFSKNFLTIAKDGQAIPLLNPYGLLCGGLLLLITIADKEIARREELGRTLEYLLQQFAHLELMKILPDDIEQREFVINRALDVRSASMLYLAISIRHDTSLLGTPGRVVKTFFLGDDEINDSKAYLAICVENYHRTLSGVGVRMIIEVREIVKGIAALNLQNQKEPEQLEDNFLVPYQANSRFIGRAEFLQKLKEALYNVAPRKDNHRVALYGMGGIGKTQCALGYIYANRDAYERIYWISAVDNTSILSGYQNIAKAAKLHFRNANDNEIAKSVLSWLRQQQSWLLIIDNLDDIQVANGLLPENGPQKHTIITTRNPNAEGIPAEPLEVPLLDVDSSILLLSTLSKITVQPNSPEESQAAEIVGKLGYLPLAIEQAGAYVREVTANFSAFLEEYEQNHKRLHMWVPSGNRQYPNSIATTWSMSLSLLPNDPVNLLRFFSFLNPNGILIAFLVSGADALEEDLRHIIFDRIKMATALLELEKFSLIKWDRPNKSITIHRLVQTVVRDEMSNEELRSTQINIINLFVQAFPVFTTNETRSVCRMYYGQMLEPLTHMITVCTCESALIRVRLGQFLCADGKYDDSQRLLVQAVEIYQSILGAENLDTLSAMHNLASTYQKQGRHADAAGIQEEVLGKWRTIFGEEHPNTLRAMNNLARTYVVQGRHEDAARIQEEVLEKGIRILGKDQLDTLTAMNNLAWTYMEQGKYAEAVTIQEEVLEKRRRILGEEHTDTLGAMNNLAWTYVEQGKYGDAVTFQEEVLEKGKKILGKEHPDTLTAMSNLAWTYVELGRHRDAAAIQEEVLEKRRKILGEEHPDTLTAMSNLAWTYMEQGRHADAAKFQEDVLEKRKRILGEEHPDTLTAMSNLAWTYVEQRKYGDAATIQEEVLKKRRRILGEEHPDTLTAMSNLAWTYAEIGRLGDAVTIQEEVLEKRMRILGEEHPNTLLAMSNLTWSYRKQGRHEEAARIMEVLEKWRTNLGEKHSDTLGPINRHGNRSVHHDVLWSRFGC